MPKFFVNGSTGDVSFYEDTGTDVKMHWDASSERLGIGTSSPAAQLHVLDSTADTNIVVESTFAGGDARLSLYANSAGISQIRFGDEGSTNVGLLTYDHSDNSMQFRANSGERMRIDSSGNVGIGTTTPGAKLEVAETNDATIRLNYGNPGTSEGEDYYGGVEFYSTETPYGGPAVSAYIRAIHTRAGTGHNNADAGLVFGTSEGTSILPAVERMRIESGTGNILPGADNAQDLGSLTKRYDDVYATNGTIQTSDRNEKQDIEELSEAEQRVAVAAKGLLRKYRWKDKVAEKGDEARIHFGIIAQDLQAAFEAEGLDAGRYGMFIHSTWWETYTDVPAVEAKDAVLDDEGNVIEEAVEAKEAYTRTDTHDEPVEGATEKSRMGIRYPELLAFIIAAI